MKGGSGEERREVGREGGQRDGQRKGGESREGVAGRGWAIIVALIVLKI